MINVADIVADSELQAPKPFTILRSTGQWTQGGFVSTTSEINQVGPVQRASDLEVQMFQEADRVGGIMAFWCLVPVFLTRAEQTSSAEQGVTPQGVFPGTVYTVDPSPIGSTQVTLYKNGVFQVPGLDFTYDAATGTITMTSATAFTDKLYLTWTNVKAGAAASDILRYANEQYRILNVRHYPGSGYWKALGTRLSTV